MDKNTLSELLSKVEKPARYIGGELNMTSKTDADYSFALCFPDVYEIGMSHLGSRILYNILNKRTDTICERVYAPWIDMEKLLFERSLPLFSLETKRDLNKFNIIGFSLLYEMSYTGILNMLDMSGIPLRSKDRGEEMPLIVCGGPCACNPEPIADFMDVVMIGDGEELCDTLMDIYADSKRRGLTKKELLLMLSKHEGFYIPAFYEPIYSGSGNFLRINKLEDEAPKKAKRCILKNLDTAEYLGELIVPYMSIVHDRVPLEIFRGCTRGCRFCQAGFIYRPVRERKRETLMKYARELIDHTGYDEISLFSLSSGDYSEIHELVHEILDEFSDQDVSISLPSLRVDSLLKEDLERIQSIRKSGLTLAPEAGTQRLRDVINKCVTEDDIMRSVSDAFESGWHGVKLYFMLGLPTETDEDILAIAELARRISRLFYSMPKEKRGKGLRLTVSVSSFVPKPFTPFQWVAQDDIETIMRKQRLLKDALKGIRGVEYQYHAVYTSELEAVLARGDRRISNVIEGAYRRGARLDSWDECFKREAYTDAFIENGLTMEQYTTRVHSLDEPLPWDHIDMVVTKDYLINEYKKALNEITTKDCREGCNGCFGDRYADYCKIQ
ncbi:MAG: TIGR03960 family B12-binding radical SAM protein [Clostridia bacterium]|nr:TIGR03960 family B12-binding radical SAM protein [Clostridia bacterium]